jgi:hypothetical protein
MPPAAAYHLMVCTLVSPCGHRPQGSSWPQSAWLAARLAVGRPGRAAGPGEQRGQHVHCAQAARLRDLCSAALDLAGFPRLQALAGSILSSALVSAITSPSVQRRRHQATRGERTQFLNRLLSCNAIQIQYAYRDQHCGTVLPSWAHRVCPADKRRQTTGAAAPGARTALPRMASSRPGRVWDSDWPAPSQLTAGNRGAGPRPVWR